jgi:hypothetical protein
VQCKNDKYKNKAIKNVATFPNMCHKDQVTTMGFLMNIFLHYVLKLLSVLKVNFYTPKSCKEIYTLQIANTVNSPVVLLL